MASTRAPLDKERLDYVAGHLGQSKVLWDEPMSGHTSFGIGGPCDLLVLPTTEADAITAWVSCKEASVPCRIVGNGTNLLVLDGGVRGCVVKVAPHLSGVSCNSSVTITARSGTLLGDLVKGALHEGLSGIEWAVGIPGSVGGAVVMNAGAYGGEMASLVKRVRVAGEDGKTWWIDSKELDFSYRHSLFTGRDDLLIVSAEFALTTGDKEAIRKVMEARATERETKQPLDLPSAGSAFRRPPGHYVGAMIQELGLKGFTVGGAQISPKHAGFIVNVGGATAKDVLTLMETVQAKVKDAFGVDLTPEVIVIGEDAAPAGE